MGMSRADIVDATNMLNRGDLNKYMTTQRNHKVWMDVYHAKTGGSAIYSR